MSEFLRAERQGSAAAIWLEVKPAPEDERRVLERWKEYGLDGI